MIIMGKSIMLSCHKCNGKVVNLWYNCATSFELCHWNENVSQKALVLTGGPQYRNMQLNLELRN